MAFVKSGTSKAIFGAQWRRYHAAGDDEAIKGLDISSSVTICNEEHRFFVAEQLREINMLGSIILEPMGRNTAPAIALAAFTSDDDPLLLVLAADHVIQDELAFTKAVSDALPLAEAGKLVTFGIFLANPTRVMGTLKKEVRLAQVLWLMNLLRSPPVSWQKNIYYRETIYGIVACFFLGPVAILMS